MKNLPPFTVRESPKAKRVTLKISARQGLEVVIPQGFNRHQIPGIIREKQDWIEQAFRKIQPPGSPLEQPRLLPAAIHLEAVNLRFAVHYVPIASPVLELVHLNTATLQITGDISNLQGCQELLKRWLNHQGRLRLIPWLQNISAEFGLSYQRAQIRRQKSRWGSCSSRGTICLNQNLLFFRPPLVRYIIIHELCHTVHLNHAPGFYQLQAQFVPNYQELRAEMNRVREKLPWWAL